MSPRRLAVYGVLGVLAVLVVFGVHRWFSGRDALRDAELASLRAADSVKVQQYAAKVATLTRQLAAASASVDSADDRYRRSEALRRGLVLIARRPGTQPPDSTPVTREEQSDKPDTVLADPRVIELVAALDSTIDQQRRAIARQSLALSTATGALVVADSLLANRARQIAVLQRMIPSRWGQRAKLVGAISVGVAIGWKVGTVASR